MPAQDIRAYVLIRTEPGEARRVAEMIVKLAEVEDVA